MHGTIEVEGIIMMKGSSVDLGEWRELIVWRSALVFG